jgi:FKBP-type peptidyl-prolyl cis-trans isomerase
MKSFFSGKLRRLPVALLGLLTAGLLTTACKKDDTTAAPDYTAADDAAITKYLAANSITTAQKQASGLYYVPLVTNASATKPVAGNTVSLLYTGKLLDGTTFDASSQHNNMPVSFQLGGGQVIPGFDEGVSLMHLADSAIFIIPSGLAYGPSGSGSVIPANSVVRFNVKLADINFVLTDDKLITKYLSVNSIINAQKQASGLYFVPGITNATAATTPGKTVSVLYTGKLLDGTVFDASSQHNNTPLQFVVGATPKQVIPGFDEGISLMHKGDKATLLIPSNLAYGFVGAGTSVPANSVLRFDVEVTNVQ